MREYTFVKCYRLSTYYKPQREPPEYKQDLDNGYLIWFARDCGFQVKNISETYGIFAPSVHTRRRGGSNVKNFARQERFGARHIPGVRACDKDREELHKTKRTISGKLTGEKYVKKWNGKRQAKTRSERGKEKSLVNTAPQGHVPRPTSPKRRDPERILWSGKLKNTALRPRFGLFFAGYSTLKSWLPTSNDPVDATSFAPPPDADRQTTLIAVTYKVEFFKSAAQEFDFITSWWEGDIWCIGHVAALYIST
ncbi:hypothetical protein EDD18DRAFT_1328523 [Armillaria luteobubalina]|uniref:Uncharacterized protein n=1 Tax=Armillaria luteobubalina TaxID=153913 RepID=A0AA39QFY7_9AGAR|nr:hypothetical protein EDD18DRAFT_1328523 [Armillaria luteobubalina]